MTDRLEDIVDHEVGGGDECTLCVARVVSKVGALQR
jgi:hypothetical protein